MLRPEETLLADHRNLLPRRTLAARAQVAPADRRAHRRSLELAAADRDPLDTLKRGLLGDSELRPKRSAKRDITDVIAGSIDICSRSDELKRALLAKEIRAPPTKERPEDAQERSEAISGRTAGEERPECKVSSSEQAKKLFFLAREPEPACARRGRVPPHGAAAGAREERARHARSWYAGYGTLPSHDPDKTGGGGATPPAEGGARTSPGAPRRALDYLLGPGLRGLAARRPQPVRRAASRDSALDTSAAASVASTARLRDDDGLRKCSTALSLSAQAAAAAPARAVNRLRAPSLCSRCSSLLSLAGGSRYSLDGAGGFAVSPSPSAECTSAPAAPAAPQLLCKLCLERAPPDRLTALRGCGCAFCTKCMQAYVEFEVCNGAYEVSCPDAQCRLGGALTLDEIRHLVSADTLQKHLKFRLNHEVAMDRARAFCPRAGCDTVVPVRTAAPAHCPACRHDFCPDCNQEWHGGTSCEAAAAAAGSSSGPGAPLLPDGELIKWCPMCRVPIEKDDGCAQMMCKRCKHVFCWYCLASLDDDFLLRHYDKGPCKNKLGHSRASVIWHRAQVVGIFAGFGLLLLVASPLLLLAAPCIVCCKCRLCNPNGAKNLEEVEGDESGEADKLGPRAAASSDDEIAELARD